MGDTLKDNKLNKALKIGKNIVLILLIIGVIQMFYDGDSTNDHFGWLFMMVFFGIKIISSFMISLKEGDKKAVLLDVGLMIFLFFLLFLV